MGEGRGTLRAAGDEVDVERTWVPSWVRGRDAKRVSRWIVRQLQRGEERPKCKHIDNDERIGDVAK